MSLRAVVVLGLTATLVAPAEPASSRPGRYAWPLAPPHPVVRAFSAPPTPYGPGHRGVDLGGTAGEAVFAAGGGTVVFAGPVGGRPVVSLAHDSGLRTTYEPVEPTVRAGAPIRRGDRIGTLLAGHDGCPVTACLHWGARRGLDYLNPIRLVTSSRVRLLPLEPAAKKATTTGSLTARGFLPVGRPTCDERDRTLASFSFAGETHTVAAVRAAHRPGARSPPGRTDRPDAVADLDSPGAPTADKATIAVPLFDVRDWSWPKVLCFRPRTTNGADEVGEGVSQTAR